jgi:molecular chaperone Hsp33
MNDEIKKYLVYEGRVSVAIARTTEMIEQYRKEQDLTPTTTAVMGRFLTMAGLMGHTDMKGEDSSITLQMNGNGPIGNVVAVVKKENDTAIVKGYCENNKVELPLKSNGKIDVSGSIGRDGFLNVIYETGGKQGYKGVIPIVSGEIAEDFTNYFATSQQTPNVVALGVLVNKDGVVASGGYKIELMPDATNDDINKLEEAVKKAPSISTLIEQGKSLNEIVEIITGDENSMVLAKDLKIEYKCDCSKEKFFSGLKTLGKEELKKVIENQEEIETVCHFCGKKYKFSKAEIEKLL